MRYSQRSQDGILPTQDSYEWIRTSKGDQYWPSMKFIIPWKSKLHIFDTNGLHNYRLVHESTPNPMYTGGSEVGV